MTDTTFPTTGDTITQAALLRAFKKTAGASDYVVGSGDYVVTDSGGLNVDIAAGEAFVNGKFVKRDVATTDALTLASNQAALYVYLEYTAAQNGLQFGSTTTAPDTETGWAANPERILLAQVVTGASSITSITDRRNTVAVSGWGPA